MITRRKFMGGSVAVAVAAALPALPRDSLHGVPITWDTGFDPSRSVYSWWRGEHYTATAQAVIQQSDLTAQLQAAWKQCLTHGTAPKYLRCDPRTLDYLTEQINA